MPTYKFYEFFAGGGMARAGLGRGWRCLLANDIDSKKAGTYKANWGTKNLVTANVAEIGLAQLRGVADLAWASFPCQDLSQAGGGAGLKGKRSGVFWPFWSKMIDLDAVGRAPKIIVLENVQGTISSHSGKDFEAICSAFSSLDYQYGAILVDAREFLPQSRPRLFFIGVRGDLDIPVGLTSSSSSERWHTKRLIQAQMALPANVADKWLWWRPEAPKTRAAKISDVLQSDDEVLWHTEAKTNHLIALMDDRNLKKLDAAKQAREKIVGAIYRRRRPSVDGSGAVQRAEVRFDDLAGCLRTPAGGSSLQTVIVVNGDSVRSRLLTPREAARLMGLPESYALPDGSYDAYHLIGDGVAVPVVKFLADELIRPVLGRNAPIKAPSEKSGTLLIDA